MLIPNTNSLQIANLGFGGAENQLLKQLKYFQKIPEINIYLVTQYSEFLPTNSNIEILQIGTPKKKNFLPSLKYIYEGYRKIKQKHRENPFDIIQIHMMGISAILGVLVSKHLKIPTILKVSGKISEVREDKSRFSTIDWILKKIILRLRKWIIKNIDNFQVLNQEMHFELVNLYGVNQKNIYFLPNGIDLEPITVERDAISNIENFGFVGRFEPVKNIFFLLRAFSQFVRIYPEVKLLLFGRGSLEGKIRKYILENNIDDNVNIIGFVQDKSQIYRKINVFLNVSLSEGISNSILEAMAYGIPIVASKIPGNETIIKDGENGLLFGLEHEENLVEKMIFITQNPEIREKIRDGALKRIHELYNMEIIVKKLRNIYENILIKTS